MKPVSEALASWDEAVGEKIAMEIPQRRAWAVESV